VGHDRALDVEAFHRFVDEYRGRCLWFVRSDYYPATPAECVEVLRLIERHGDRRALGRVAQFRRWLSPHFSETFAGS
jgi:hypothetical protein